MGQLSLKVIEISAIRKLWCGFLFAFYSNYGGQQCWALWAFLVACPCTLFIDVISLFVDWANKDACLLALVSFARYSDLLVKNREIFIPHLYLAPPQEVPSRNFAKTFDTHKTRMIGLL